MRIVHDVDSPMTVGAGFDGANRCHIHAFTGCAANHPNLPPQIFGDEAIEIEGNPEYLIPMVESWLKCLRSVQKHVTEKAATREKTND